MSSKSTTRFGVVCGGSLRQIFSIIEQRDSGLIIVNKNELAFYDNEQKEMIRENRFTVHPSLNSSGTTITNNVIFNNDKNLSNVCFIEDSKDYLLWPIVVRLCPRLDMPHYMLKSRTKDIVYQLQDELPLDSSLVYVIFVARSAFDFPEIKSLNRIVHNFKIFSIAVYFSYVNIPATTEAYYCSLKTSSLIVKKVELPIIPNKGKKSIKVEQMHAAMFELMQWMVAIKVSRMANTPGVPVSVKNALMSFKPMYSKRPLSRFGVKVLEAPEVFDFSIL